MFWRLSGVVICVAVCGAWVLTLRHNRVQAQSELTQAQLRINKQDEKLWLLRARIAGRVTPPEIERLCDGLGPLHPILPYSPAGNTAIALLDVKNTPPVVGPDGKPKTKPAAPKTTKPAAPKAAPKKDAKPPARKDAAKPAVNPPTRLAAKPSPQG